MSTTTVELVNAPATPLPELSKTSSATSTQAGAVFPAENSHNEDMSKGKTVVVISSVTCITAISSLLAGVVTVCIPAMARDVNLEGSLLLWPASVYALTCGCTLLLSGAMADLFGARQLYLLGCFFQSVFTLACGLANTGTQLIVFRAFAGVAISMCLPSAVSIITHAFPSGKRRNIAFASMGGGQPIGFSVGLSVGGVFTDTIGWRWGFHMAAIINTVIFLIALNVITESTSDIKKPANVALLVISGVLVGSFIGWVERQERLGRPAIIANTLWKNRSFTSICVSVFLVWGAFNATEQLGSLYLQYVQRLSATDTSVRFLPAPVGGVLANVAAGLVVHRVRADVAILVAVALAALSPLLMAAADPAWKLLGVAGGVYNTIAQIGKSVGLASSGTIASAVAARSAVADKESPPALLDGYRASFWYCFALYGATLLVTVWGLRKIGKVGVKKE
ncbi:putative MFS-type transporter [Colletotrichum sidae]|uniref:Putative MFS-type transporter n=1 Tax=Colletotrichum sidae TaxID=1347389 RepID=A0A4V3I339_9PEZI|nr:putative MFS-type transporter [Colletotrichum sidae]